MRPDKIPIELQQQRKWVPFKVGPELNGNGKPKKVPLIAGTDRMASVTDPSTWTTFEEACKWGHPAYVLTEDDGLIFIDFDGSLDTPLARQLWEAFPSYTEKSTSGNGWHIIVGGSVGHTQGMRRGGVEVYTDRRFCLFTGDVVEGREEIIPGNEELLRHLSEQMGKINGHEKNFELDDLPATEDDEIILEKCQRSEKFRKLWAGDWHGAADYPSQSEADHALVGEICRHTVSNDQAYRLFQRSGLFRQHAPHKFNYSLERVRANQVKEREADEFCRDLIPLRLPTPVVNLDCNDPALYSTLPEGLLRDLFNAYMAASFRPLKEASLIAALGTAIALFSRNTQTPTHLALNMWLFVIGDSSDGKEMSSKGPKRLFREARAAMKGVLGGELRSSPGVEDALKPSAGGSLRHVAYHGECDAWIRGMCDDRASIGAVQLRSKLMESYTKGADSWALRQIKVKKDEDKEYDLERPCLSIVGDCVSSCFYESVGGSQAASGFLPRFSVLEVDTDSVSRKMNVEKPYPPALLDRIRELSDMAMKDDVDDNFRVARIEPDAHAAFCDYVEGSWNYMLDRRMDKENALRGKLGEKLIKLATLCAVCRNPEAPVINLADFEWGKLFVEVTDGRMLRTLDAGKHDPSPLQQYKNVQQALDRSLTIPPTERRKKTKHFPSEQLQSNISLCTYGWLRSQVAHLACFSPKAARSGVASALNMTLRDLEHAGEITVMSPDKSREEYGCKSIVIVNLRYADTAVKLF